ncbi:DNA-processing protein DprA [Lysobacter sp. S4-A87]|uniref:DNA-processing protein DprA n=1 Tax=Lysobacter sp. S4-A87 TaxID=2925843 RepID=UPI001F53DE6A|nr:DNA-processing protein DprA [Lysobacter sp. S4-A87]UNK48512.1 DNA-processing protein DprA [Lysobacter sp. S4-A87]
MPPAPPPPPATAPGDDAHALLRLLVAAGAVEPRRRLLERHGSAAQALAAGPAAWRECGLAAQQMAKLSRPDAVRLENAEKWLREPGHHLLDCRHCDYPALLLRGPNPPLALFVAGDPTLLWHPSVAIVGTRGPTPAGTAHAADFAHALARSGLAVTSGLAAGIDTAAHEATLAADGITVAVLGTGPDVAYPRANARLLARIAERGAVVSEHLPGTGPSTWHFPTRNRIIAGLSLATLVIEAAWQSGALITARLAAEAGRDVFALPGSIRNPLARGCHRLIREGAGLVEDPAEVIAALAPQAQVLAQDLRTRLDAPIHRGEEAVSRPAKDSAREDPDYQQLWLALGHDPTNMDELVTRTGLTAAAVSSMLLLMELDGRVQAQHGRYFRNR